MAGFRVQPGWHGPAQLARVRGTLCSAVGFILLAAGAARGLVLDEASAAFNRGDYDTTISLLAKEVDSNPGHEAAYRLLGRAYEQKKDLERARDVWTRLASITRAEPLKTEATRSLIRIREAERGGKVDKQVRFEEDPFHVPGIKELIEEYGGYRDLDKIDDDKYRPQIIAGQEMMVPPIVYETRHFTVYACNVKLSRLIGLLAEKYLDFLKRNILDDRAWAIRVPILVYKNHDDYVSVGHQPAGSGGVTYPDHLGRSEKVAIFQNATPEEMVFFYNASHPVQASIEDILPHELTHVMINELFGAQEFLGARRIPKWLHEAFARQMEQNRDDYRATADLARDAVAGEYFRFRDLFAAWDYPSGGRTGRFYEQSATIVLFVLEQGPAATRAFLTELADQHGHDAAVAAALGIPVQGAVDEFERRWVEWMNKRYAQDLERSAAEKERDKTADSLKSSALLPPIDELATAAKVKKWRTIELDKPIGANNRAFAGAGDSLDDWKIADDKLRCRALKKAGTSFLGIRMNEHTPLAVRCKVRWLAETEPGATAGWFGLGMLNSKNEDTGAQALFKLDSGRTRDVLCFVGDDIAVFVDGVCTGRSPAPTQDKNEADIDYPVALVSHSAVEVSDLEVVQIKPREFVLRDESKTDSNDPNAAASPSNPSGSGKQATGASPP
ncbi:MAG TPA: hypothetical protein VGM03_11900 [Phycisphaerae bacterium]